jgi:hypothetical protein
MSSRSKGFGGLRRTEVLLGGSPMIPVRGAPAFLLARVVQVVLFEPEGVRHQVTVYRLATDPFQKQDGVADVSLARVVPPH